MTTDKWPKFELATDICTPPPIQTLEYRTSCQTSGTVNNNSPISDYFHRDDHTQPTYFLGIV